MKRTHVFLPEPLIQRLKAEAKKTGLTAAEIIRRALDQYFSKPK